MNNVDGAGLAVSETGEVCQMVLRVIREAHAFPAHAEIKRESLRDFVVVLKIHRGIRIAEVNIGKASLALGGCYAAKQPVLKSVQRGEASRCRCAVECDRAVGCKKVVTVELVAVELASE